MASTTWFGPNQLTYIFAKEKGKLRYLNGKIFRSDETDTSFSKWEANDHMVMSWLLNFMNWEITKVFIFLDSAREIWDSLGEIYGKGENLARVYQLEQVITKMNKGEKAFHLYLSSLKSMWEKLQQHNPLRTNLETIKKHQEEDKVLKLLAGLKTNYENV